MRSHSGRDTATVEEGRRSNCQGPLEQANLPVKLFDGLEILERLPNCAGSGRKTRNHKMRIYRWAMTGRLLLGVLSVMTH